MLCLALPIRNIGLHTTRLIPDGMDVSSHKVSFRITDLTPHSKKCWSYVGPTWSRQDRCWANLGPTKFNVGDNNINIATNKRLVTKMYDCYSAPQTADDMRTLVLEKILILVCDICFSCQSRPGNMELDWYTKSYKGVKGVHFSCSQWRRLRFVKVSAFTFSCS